MGVAEEKKLGRLKRKKRIRKKLAGTSKRPRLCVFRSAKHIYAQLIDDIKGHTLVSASTADKALRQHLDFTSGDNKGKLGDAFCVGKVIGERASEKGIDKVVFDRNGFLYHGRVKAVSDGAREAGLKF